MLVYIIFIFFHDLSYRSGFLDWIKKLIASERTTHTRALIQDGEPDPRTALIFVPVRGLAGLSRDNSWTHCQSGRSIEEIIRLELDLKRHYILYSRFSFVIWFHWWYNCVFFIELDIFYLWKGKRKRVNSGYWRD